MVIDNLNVIRITVIPDETDTPLLIDSNAVTKVASRLLKCQGTFLQGLTL